MMFLKLCVQIQKLKKQLTESMLIITSKSYILNRWRIIQHMDVDKLKKLANQGGEMILEPKPNQFIKLKDDLQFLNNWDFNILEV